MTDKNNPDNIPSSGNKNRPGNGADSMPGSPSKANGGADTDRPSVIPLEYSDKDSLHRAYMPFVKGGGLFLPTSKSYSLNEEVFLLVTLPNSKKPLPVPGRVVWQTPAGAMDSRRQGIGIEFKGREGNGLRNQIEGVLGAKVSSVTETFTM
jgi:type IV pilus assembly protein PilZ